MGPLAKKFHEVMDELLTFGAQHGAAAVLALSFFAGAMATMAIIEEGDGGGLEKELDEFMDAIEAEDAWRKAKKGKAQ